MEPVSHPDNEVPPPFDDLFRLLIDDILAYFSAEREVYSVQARYLRRGAGWIAVFALGAIVLAQGAMIGLVVGLLFTLVPIIGAGWSTTLIVVGCSLIAGLFVRLIQIKLRSLREAWRRRHVG